jgi:hypothetical protein
MFDDSVVARRPKTAGRCFRLQKLWRHHFSATPSTAMNFDWVLPAAPSHERLLRRAICYQTVPVIFFLPDLCLTFDLGVGLGLGFALALRLGAVLVFATFG